MMQRLLGAATRTPLSDLDPARTERLREIFHDGVPGPASTTVAAAPGRQAFTAGEMNFR
jgi:hypothetical protein